MNNLSDAEAAIVRRYLGTLTALEFAVPRAADNLDTDQAAVWTRNRDELRDRAGCSTIGVAACAVSLAFRRDQHWPTAASRWS